MASMASDDDDDDDEADDDDDDGGDDDFDQRGCHYSSMRFLDSIQLGSKNFQSRDFIFVQKPKQPLTPKCFATTFKSQA